VVPGDFTVLLDQTRGAVTPLIYGHNWYSATQFTWKAIGRFGGDPTSVHNYTNDTYNAGNDYYFENVTMTNGGYQTWEAFLQAGTTAGAPILLVVPTIGWVAGTAGACSYPSNEFANQAAYAPGCTPSATTTCCGNGHVDGAFITTQAQLDGGGLYVPSSPSDVVAWLTKIQGTYGASVWDNLYVGLDNEPDWWDTTHYDVHPSPVSIAEAWTNDLAYASAIKAAFPTVKIIGPDWVEYWETSDITTYLQNIASYRAANDVQLIDYLDLHFYPGNGSLSFSCTGMPDATRLQAPRLLWDPTYPDPTDNTFGGPMYLIPRYKALVAQTNAQVKLAISEYNFGLDSCAAGAVAQAELLAIFGRYGLDMATRWGDDPNATPANYDGLLPAGSAAESAFRLFLEHDVVGTSVVVESRVAGTLDPDAGIGTNTGDGGFTVEQVTAYGVLNGATINVALFNKETSPVTVEVQLGHAGVTTAQAWGFSVASTTLAPVTAPTVVAGLATITLPAESATLVSATLPTN
jgi:Glycoside hydrolase family 44